jgi:DNA-binding beta-propeller fold protein YncE
MAAFVTRTQDSALRRGSRKAALGQWAIPDSAPLTGRTTVGTSPAAVKSDGADLWVADVNSADVKRVRASDGAVLGTWTGAVGAVGVLVARGRVYVTGQTSPGRLYMIDPTTTPGAVVTLTSTLGNQPTDVTTDGHFIWTANLGGSVSGVDPDTGGNFSRFAGFSAPGGSSLMASTFG